MKKMVYVIVTLLALTLIINVSAISEESTLKIEGRSEIIELNPLY